jgi:acyl phosphate:glycerol-3-phosphate acyltransferase
LHNPEVEEIMPVLEIIGIIVLSYLIGSLPFGWIVVKASTGRDIRGIESGRTGGTNAMRAAGVLAGVITALLDVGKGILAVSIARSLLPEEYPYRDWILVLSSLLVIIGHNYSIYLLERHEDTGRLRLRGGAGGAACFGGAMGLWAPVGLIVFPLALAVYYFIGYASVTTLSIAFFTIIVFSYKALQGTLPWQYIIYGVVAEIILIWALRPNLERLRQGTERIHGFRVWLRSRAQKSQKSSN